MPRVDRQSDVSVASGEILVTGMAELLPSGLRVSRACGESRSTVMVSSEALADERDSTEELLHRSPDGEAGSIECAFVAT